jgi:hypothetical protein
MTGAEFSARPDLEKPGRNFGRIFFSVILLGPI